MSHHPPPPASDRRSFLVWLTNGLGAIFAAILGVPIVSYLIDPLNRPNPSGDFRPVGGLRLNEIQDIPVQGVVRDIRFDAWTLYPNDVIGRVWVRRVRPGNTKECFEVFSTECPHLGCAINCNAEQAAAPGFTCPCHNGQFLADGSKKPNGPGYENPAPRGMDTLEFQVAGDQMLVKYEVFNKATEEKKRRA